MNKTYEIVGIGNAVFDIIAPTTDDFLAQNGIEKGIMQLIDQDRAEQLYASMTHKRSETPGGSVANTLAGLGALGVRSAFIGRVADDDLGRRYAQVMAAEGTQFPNPPVAGVQLPTSRSMIFVTPDGERSMNTYLGISSQLDTNDVQNTKDVLEDCAFLFLEGYLFDKDAGKEAFFKAAEITQKAGGQAGIALSDPFCVDRHRDDFRKLIDGPLSYFLCNEEELKSLYQVNDLDTALNIAAQKCEFVACTRSQKGVTICNKDQRWNIDVQAVVPIDATGAGDQFAAGFLYGLLNDYDLGTCGRMGCIAAGEVIMHLGPRPKTPVRALFKEQGVL